MKVILHLNHAELTLLQSIRAASLSPDRMQLTTHQIEVSKSPETAINMVDLANKLRDAEFAIN